MAYSYNSKSYNQTKKNYLSAFLATFLAILLTVLPLPDFFVWIWPQWIMLIVVYFVFTAPHAYGIVFGFVLGLITDFLIGNAIGLHALTYSISCYFLLRIQQRIVFFRVVQQFFLVFVFVFFDHIAPALFPKINFNLLIIEHVILSSLVTTFLWLFMIIYFGSNNKLFKVE